MANPNPSPKTRFSSDSNPAGGRGRQKGARDRLNAAFIEALADSFETYGAATIERVRIEDPSAYLRIVASVVPKEIELKRGLFDEWSEDQLTAAIEVIEDAVANGPMPEAADQVVELAA